MEETTGTTETITFDWDELTTREAKTLEELAGATVPVILAAYRAGVASVAMTQALVVTGMLQADPDADVADLIERTDRLKLTELAAQAVEIVPEELLADEVGLPADGFEAHARERLELEEVEERVAERTGSTAAVGRIAEANRRARTR